MSVRFLGAWFVVALALSLVSRSQLRAGAQSRCALDGARIHGAASVELFEHGARSQGFCSIECALAWPADFAAEAAPRFEVREEQDGVALDPRAATFVRSELRSAGGRGTLRAFRDPLAAAEHVRAHGGALVQNPFTKDD
jgi:hypothetical protein